MTPSVARADGGPAEVIRGLIPALRDRGVEADVFSTDKGLSQRDQDLSSVGWLRRTRSTGPSSLTYSQSFARELGTVIGQYDVVHVHGFQSYPGSTGMRLARRAGIPYVIEPHGALNRYHWQANARRKRLYRAVMDSRNLRNLAGVVYSSALEAEQGCEVLSGVRSLPMTLGVDEKLFAVSRRPDLSAGQTILYLGRLTRKKRVDLLVRALAEKVLNERAVRLIVAGGADGSIGDPAALATELGVSDRVLILGPVDAAVRERLLAEAHVFALPSEDESFGVAVAEAMASGLPVVTSSRVGVAQDAHAHRALVVAQNQPGPIAVAIANALDDPTLGARARGYASEKFRWGIAAGQIIDAYSVIQNKADNAP